VLTIAVMLALEGRTCPMRAETGRVQHNRAAWHVRVQCVCVVCECGARACDET